MNQKSIERYEFSPYEVFERVKRFMEKDEEKRKCDQI
jgi:hypothetical protein